MRVYQHYTDYQHIWANGNLNNWSKDMIETQQRIAYNLDAPWDTVEMVEGKPTRFSDLPINVKKLFGGVK